KEGVRGREGRRPSSLNPGEISRLPLALGLDVNIYYVCLFSPRRWLREREREKERSGGGSGVSRDPRGCQCPVVRVSGPCKLPSTARASPSDAESHLLRQRRGCALRRLLLVLWHHGPCDPHPTYTDLSSHHAPPPQGRIQEAPKLTHL
uniref:DUF4074 domain-containing protein n=1 Tax=Spermophilus dauricus TaxID=99837 RepID=A0A8C9PPY4_SPEDA